MLTLTPIAGLLVGFALVLVLTPLVRHLAHRAGAVDKRSARKVHAREVPRLGGVAIAVGFYVPILVLSLRTNAFQIALYEDPRRIGALLLGGLVILALGVYDDLRGASAGGKLVVQVPVATFAWWAGVRIGGAALSSGDMVSFGPALSLALTVAWIVVVINAINLIDGLDGLASGVVLLALVATAISAWFRDEPALALIAIVLSGCVGGFLVHNFHPATIFMGDSGSMFLGYVLAVAAVWSSQKAAATISLILPAVALGLPLLDTSLAILRRVASRRPVMTGDLDHLHHRLLAIGRSHTQAVVTLYLVEGVFCVLSVVMVVIDNRRVQLALLALSAAAALAFAAWLARRRRLALAGGPEGSSRPSPG